MSGMTSDDSRMTKECPDAQALAAIRHSGFGIASSLGYCPLSFCLGLAALVLMHVPSLAEEPPHLDFVRGLRAKGMPDLALQYLQKLSENPPPALAPLLPMELAKTRLEMAQTEPNAARRTAVQNAARGDLETFVKNNAKHPLAPEANLEIARIVASQGKAQLGRALHQEQGTQARELLKARAHFEEASKRFQAASAQIDAQLAGLATATPGQSESERQALADAKLQAELEQGINLLEQAQTYRDQSDDAKRGEILKQAIDVLDKLSKRREPPNSICWQALAWLGRCHVENDDPKTARDIFRDVIAQAGEEVDTGRRLARYFRVKAIAKDVDAKNKPAEIQKAGEEWLAIYPNYLNSPEGLAVRFELADAYYEQGRKAPKRSRLALDSLRKARNLFQALEQTDNDYATEAHEKKLLIILAEDPERIMGDPNKLKDFTECYLRAQLEAHLLNKESEKLQGKELEAKRKQRYQNVLEALNRGLDLADATVSAEEVNDARYLLTYTYLASEDYYRAAVTGEDLARTEAKSARAPMAGAYALRAYTLILSKEEQAGTPQEDLEADRGRLRNLAQYVEQTWPTDSAADTARHMLAFLLLTEKNYAEAMEVLDRISAGYPQATQVLYQLAGAALEAQKDEKIKPRSGKQSYQDRAVAALLQIPELSSDADAGTIQAYFGSKLMLADIYYKNKQYEKVDALAGALLKRLDGLDEKTKAEYRVQVLGLTLYAKLGHAESEYSAGHYDKVQALLDPIVNQVKDPAQEGQYAELKDKSPGLLRALLGLDLRANVQDNKIDRGKDILELSDKIFPENSMDILVQLVQQLQVQIQQLRKQGDSAKAQLDKLLASLSTFLDQLAQQQEKKPKPEVLLFLAQSYSSLDNHNRAVELLNKFPEPKPAEGKTEADPKQIQLYRAARLLLVRELRLNQEFDKAKILLQDLRAAPWGKNRLELEIERILLLEDQEQYVLPGGKQGAIPEWDKLMRALQPKLQDNKIKEQYFDCYYHYIYCYYKNALKKKDAAKQLKDIRVAANCIIKLEAKNDSAADAAKKHFEELLEKEPPLKEQYDDLKKNSK